MKISLCNYIAGAGKNKIADYLEKEHGFKQYSFSSGIYEICHKFYGVEKKDRDLLIHVGEKLREKDIMLWINYTLRQINNEGHDRVVITDTRKILEMAYLQELGWNNLLVYCKPEIALERLKMRDGSVNEDVVLNGSTENQLRIFYNTIKTIDNSGDFAEVSKELDAYVRFLEGK